MESSDKLHRWLFLGVLFPLFILNGWLALKVFQYFQPFVTVLVLASLLAFILNYPVQFLQQYGVRRNYAVLLICLLSLVILLAVGVTIIPFLVEDFNEMVKQLPHWIHSGSLKLRAFHDWAVSRKLPVNLTQLIDQLTGRLPGELQFLAEHILKLTLDTIDSISEVILTIVLTFYLVLDGGKIWHGIFKRLPQSFASQLQQSLQKNFQNYFIGQVILASLVGLSMTITFLVLKVPFGLVFGLGVGIMSLIPFGDVLSLSVVSLLVASQDVWLAVKILAVATLVDQTIDQAIAPRLLGGFTGLSPILVIISLFLGTKVAGLLGLVIAVPVASFIKSILDEGLQTSKDDRTSIIIGANKEPPLSSSEN